MVFVYFKNGKIKVLDLANATSQDADLKMDGWKHTATIDPCVWMEYLFNKTADDEDIANEVKALGEIRRWTK